MWALLALVATLFKLSAVFTVLWVWLFLSEQGMLA